MRLSNPVRITPLLAGLNDIIGMRSISPKEGIAMDVINYYAVEKLKDGNEVVTHFSK